jgi:hypothetical protein
MLLRGLAVLFSVATSIGFLHSGRADEAKLVSEKQVSVLGDYAEAYRRARESRRMLAIYFYRVGDEASRDSFQSRLLADPHVQARRESSVVATLPTSTRVVVQGKSQRLLDHPAFAEAHGLPGVVMIDLTNPQSRHYGRVVTVYPLKAGRTLSPHYFAEMLALPPGSLTQRTMVFAVRVHPERPASARSDFSNVLAAESESHSRYQANLGVQGHHDWDTRFHRINARFAGLTAQEVCAESWPGQDLVDAAFECVDSWRQSPGHWSAVRSRHHFFGFDMKRGRNGIWYGTGIFARR